MERLKHMGLKQSFFLLSVTALLTALLLTAGVYVVCERIAAGYPQGGMSIDAKGVVTKLEEPEAGQRLILHLLEGIQLTALIILPAGGLGIAGLFFYYLKLKRPIAALQEGTRRIQDQDLDFTISEISEDELGRICSAFETMRAELQKTSQALWQQAEERRRLNAAFSHDLRNPVTVLKGSLTLLKQGRADATVLERMESYLLRIEQYIEAMSSMERLEQMPVRPACVDLAVLGSELEETARLLAPELKTVFVIPDSGSVCIDHGIFLTVAENLIGNAARFACRKLEISLICEEERLSLVITDDGPGFPSELLRDGPKPFGNTAEQAGHFGMGLYSSGLLCRKHGGDLRLENSPEGGASVAAFFQIDKKP